MEFERLLGIVCPNCGGVDIMSDQDAPESGTCMNPDCLRTYQIVTQEDFDTPHINAELRWLFKRDEVMVVSELPQREEWENARGRNDKAGE